MRHGHCPSVCESHSVSKSNCFPFVFLNFDVPVRGGVGRRNNSSFLLSLRNISNFPLTGGHGMQSGTMSNEAI